MSLSRNPAFSYIKNKFVCGYKDITGQPYAGASGRHDQESGSTDTTNGSGNRNLQLFVLAPDGTVMHAMPGYWNPHDLVRELKFAEKLGELWASEGDFAYKQDRFHRMQLEHVDSHPVQMTRRSEIQGFDRGTEIARNEAAGKGSSGDPSTVIDRADGSSQLKTTDVIMHERMALRPFLPFSEFDVAGFVDYGGQYYDKHADHGNDRASRVAQRRAASGEPDDQAGSGAGSTSGRAQAASGDHRMIAKDPSAASVAAVPPPPPPRPATPQAPPVRFRVVALAGSGDTFTAVISFRGQSYNVSAGDVVPTEEAPVFVVKSVSAERVTVQVNANQQVLSQGLPDEAALAGR